MNSLSQICETSFNTTLVSNKRKYREKKSVAYEI